MHEAIEVEEAVATARDLEVAEWRILRAIRHGPHACTEVATLLRVAAIGEPPGTAERAMRSLTDNRRHLTDNRRQPPTTTRVVIWSAPGKPDVATFTPWGADELGVVLVEPAQDDPEVEPRWGVPEELPDYYKIEENWGQMKRSRTAYENILIARAVAMEKKNPGKAARKRAMRGRKSILEKIVWREDQDD